MSVNHSTDPSACRPTRLVWPIYGLFFLSGAAGLVYQIVWLRLLNEIFGITVYAVTAVLATYLGGLALGSWWLGGVADRGIAPLRLYGWLEIGVALTALVGPFEIRGLDKLHMAMASRLASDSVTLLVLRSVLAGIVILPPTVMMGGTLTAVTKLFVHRVSRLGREFTLLYGINTAGAVVGSLTAGFVLIRAIGVHPTLWLAVVVNLAVGGASLFLGRGSRLQLDAERSPGTSGPSTAFGERPAHSAPGLVIAVALSGFASFGLEVMWTRMLVLVVGTSTYAFVTMLASFLVGIAMGSFVARTFVDRVRNQRRLFGWLQVGIAFSVLATVPLMRWLISSSPQWIDQAENGWFALLLGRFAVTFLVMIVPTTLIGMTLPIAVTAWAQKLGTLGTRVGQIYAANTIGNIAGAFGAGFLILSVLGMQKGIAVLAAMNLAAASWALFPPPTERWRLRSMLRVMPVSAGLWTCILLLAAWHPDPLPGTGGSDWDIVRYYREGLVSTVKVVQRADDGRQLLMAVDGVTIGQSSAGVDKKQQVLAHLPFLLARDSTKIRNVLSIGLGTGILVGEVAKHRSVMNVDCVEISPSVIEAAELFRPYNSNALRDPKIQIIADDGVNFLRRSGTRYDAIISDGKSKSGHAGNAVFYSQDYYRLALDHLAAEALMIQWVPLDLTPDDLRIVVRTFLSVFPHTYAWLGDESIFLVGLKHQLILDGEYVARELPRPEFTALRRYGWRDAADVLGLLIGDTPALAAWVAGGRVVNSFEWPVLEFYPLASAPGPERVAKNLAALDAVRGTGLRDVATATPLQEGIVGAVADLLRGLTAVRTEAPAATHLLERAVVNAPERGTIRRMIAEAFFDIGFDLERHADINAAVTAYVRASELWPDMAEAHINASRLLVRQGRPEPAVAHLRDALATNPESGAAHRVLGEVMLAAGNNSEASRHFQSAVVLAPSVAEIHADLAQSLAMMGRVDEALAESRRALTLKPAWPLAMTRTALLLATHPDPRRRNVDEAIQLATRASKLTLGKDPMSLEVLAAAYAAAGRFDQAADTERRVLDIAVASENRELERTVTEVLALYRRGAELPIDLPLEGRPAKQ